MKQVLAMCLFVVACASRSTSAPTLPVQGDQDAEAEAGDAAADDAEGTSESTPPPAPPPPPPTSREEQSTPVMQETSPVRTRGPVPKPDATVDPCDGGE
jgi:hypothetical protein